METLPQHPRLAGMERWGDPVLVQVLKLACEFFLKAILSLFS